MSIELNVNGFWALQLNPIVQLRLVTWPCVCIHRPRRPQSVFLDTLAVTWMICVKICTAVKHTHAPTECNYICVSVKGCYFWVADFVPIGEALNPGPEAPPDDCKRWFQIGTFNPTCLIHKEDVVASWGQGVWTACETRATAQAQTIIKSKLQQKGLNVHFSRPCANIGKGVAQLRGSATGTACISHLPIKTVPHKIADDLEFTSRLLLSYVQISPHCVLQLVTLYCPFYSTSSIHHPRKVSARLFDTAFQLAIQHNGPSIISGDLNNSLDEFPAWTWLSRAGWVDTARWSSQNNGHTLKPTSKDTCRHSFILANACAARALKWADNAPDFFFDTHPLLVSYFDWQALKAPHLRWVLPKSFDDVLLDPVLRDLSVANTTVVRDVSKALRNGNSTQAAKLWAESCENTFACAAVWPDGEKRHIPKGFLGRGNVRAPKRCVSTVPINSKARDGDFDACIPQSNIALRRWLRQLRRLQSFRNQLKAYQVNQSENSWFSLCMLWQSILHAQGFHRNFQQWQLDQCGFAWVSMPPLSGAQHLLSCFHQWYATQENTYILERKKMDAEKLLRDWHKGGALSFQRLREQHNPPISAITQESILHIPRVPIKKRACAALPLPRNRELAVGDVVHFEDESVHVVTGVRRHTFTIAPPARIQKVPIRPCLVKQINCPNACHQELADVWNVWLRREPEGDNIASWGPALEMIRSTPQLDAMSYKQFDLPVWKKLMAGVKKKSSRGTCAFSVTEMQALTDFHLEALFSIFHEIEAGAQWPVQWTTALVACLPKADGVPSALQIRPITIMSRIYRCWAKYRSALISDWLSPRVPDSLAGGVKNLCAADISALHALQLEVAHVEKSPLHGCVLDLIKCYNTIPRHPLCYAMVWAGIHPAYFLAYINILATFTRSFVVAGNAGPLLKSTSGIPEGCSMAVIAMTIFARVAFCLCQAAGASVTPFFFVDNWSFTASSMDDLHCALLGVQAFADATKVQFQAKKCWTWSNRPSVRKALRLWRHDGVLIPVKNHSCDLGVDACYSKVKVKKVWKKRASATLAALSKARGIRASWRFKKKLVTGGCLPKSAYGSEFVSISLDEFKQLRTATARAMGNATSGENPYMALSMCGRSLDPQFADLLRRLKIWRRFAHLFPRVFGAFEALLVQRLARRMPLW